MRADTTEHILPCTTSDRTDLEYLICKHTARVRKSAYPPSQIYTTTFLDWLPWRSRDKILCEGHCGQAIAVQGEPKGDRILHFVAYRTSATRKTRRRSVRKEATPIHRHCTGRRDREETRSFRENELVYKHTIIASIFRSATAYITRRPTTKSCYPYG